MWNRFLHEIPQKDSFMRKNNRTSDQIRPTQIITDYIETADGSAFIEMGKTKVIATATIEEKIPPFLKGNGGGWITAEYAMLPRATERRTVRERFSGRLSGRTQEIQRMIGRALRAATDLKALGERTIIIDCDVIQADGGTRCASINVGCVALALALKQLMETNVIGRMPLRHLVSAVSVGIVQKKPLLDLDYSEDSHAAVDMNVVKTDSGDLIEIQAAAEKEPFAQENLDVLLKLADTGINEIVTIQKSALKKTSLLFMAYG